MLTSPQLMTQGVWMTERSSTPSSRPIIHLDMDMVLVDLRRGIQTLWGYDYPPEGHLEPEAFSHLQSQVYNRIEDFGSDFWSTLPALDVEPWIHPLVQAAQTQLIDLQILTAWPRYWTPDSPHVMACAIGKWNWIRQFEARHHLEVQRFFCVPAPRKQEFGQDDVLNLLIDDMPTNITRWNDYNPHYHGILHQSNELTHQLLLDWLSRHLSHSTI